MSRWGHRLLEHDSAVHYAVRISEDIAQGDALQFAYLVVCILDTSSSPAAIKVYYEHEYKMSTILRPETEPQVIMLIRQKLDAGLGDELFVKYRAREMGPASEDYTKLTVIVLAALMMHYGAKIRDENVKYLRELISRIPCIEVLNSRTTRAGTLRGPGKRQFLAALDHYQAGSPRNFLEPSCHNCGKVNGDIKAEDKVLRKCGGCRNEVAAAWFCDKACQKELWKHHKKGNCGAPGGLKTALFTGFGKHCIAVVVYEGISV